MEYLAWLRQEGDPLRRFERESMPRLEDALQALQEESPWLSRSSQNQQTPVRTLRQSECFPRTRSCQKAVHEWMKKTNVQQNS